MNKFKYGVCVCVSVYETKLNQIDGTLSFFLTFFFSEFLHMDNCVCIRNINSSAQNLIFGPDKWQESLELYARIRQRTSSSWT